MAKISKNGAQTADKRLSAPRLFVGAVLIVCYAVEPYFCRGRYQSLTNAGNAPGMPCKVDCFFLYRVIRARLFHICSTACFWVICFRQSGQYFAWLELDAKTAPHTVQRRISSVFNNSACNSLVSSLLCCGFVTQ